MNKATFLQFLPMLSAYLILCSIVQAIVFYGCFGINLMQFVDLSELLTFFLQDLILYTLSFLNFVWLLFIIQANNERMSGIQLRAEAVAEDLFIKRLLLYLRRQKWLKVLLGMVFFVGYFLLRANGMHLDGTSYRWTLPLLVFLVIFRVVMLELERKLIKRDYNFKSSLFDLTYVLVAFLAFVTTVSGVQATYVQLYKTNYGTRIQFDDHLFVSDSASYFLGKTSKYIFVYDEAKKEATAYSIELVRAITYPKK